MQKVTDAKQTSEREKIVENAKLDILAKITEKKGEDLTESELEEILISPNYSTQGTLSSEENIIERTLTSKDGKYEIPVSKIYSGNFANNENDSFDWDFIFAEANANPEKYKNSSQTTDTRIAFGPSGETINLDLWNVVMGDDGYIVKGSTYFDMAGPHTNPGYKGAIEEGRIQGEMPMYVQSTTNVNEFIPVTSLDSTFSYISELCIDPGIPSTVKIIGENAFYGCSISSIKIPNGVTTIEPNAFGYTDFIKNLVIPSSVIRISDRTSLPINLETIMVETGNPVYDSRENCNAIIETNTNTLLVGSSSTVIPSTVTSIGYTAFGGCEGLKSITIPGNVKSIEEAAFSNCIGLGDVIIENGVESIEKSAFANCWQFPDSVGTIHMPSSVTSVGRGAFSYANNATIYVPFKEGEKPNGWDANWTQNGNPTIIYLN